VIAIYLHTLFNGGVERVVFNLAGSFVQRGMEVEIVLDALYYSPFSENVPAGVKLVELGAHSILARPPKLRSYLRQRRPEVLLSATHFANEIAIVAAGLAQGNTRVLVSEHTTLSTELSSLPGTSPRRLIPAIMRATYRHADAVVAVSKGVAEDTVKLSGLPPECVHAIYNPLDFDMIHELAAQPANHPWFAAGAEPGPPEVVLAIGRLEQQKNFGLLIDAFARVRAERDARLLILGEGSQRVRLQEKIEQMGLNDVVQMPGFLPNPFPFIAKAKVLAMSSLWEGFPLVLIEALSLKTPIVATDCPSGPSEALDGGRYGELVPMNDASALATALLEALGGKTKSAPEEWLRQFHPDYVADEYLKLMMARSS
jgi:glycosyltransferase involved in cell wall biosynthesis